MVFEISWSQKRGDLWDVIGRDRLIYDSWDKGWVFGCKVIELRFTVPNIYLCMICCSSLYLPFRVAHGLLGPLSSIFEILWLLPISSLSHWLMGLVPDHLIVSYCLWDKVKCNLNTPSSPNLLRRLLRTKLW